MTDDLDTLTDAQLSGIFAVEVAGYIGKPFLIEPEKVIWYNANGKHQIPPDFATSADDVLPWLMKAGLVTIKIFHYETCAVRIQPIVGKSHPWSCSKTLPRAACIAIIKAHRAQKGAAQ